MNVHSLLQFGFKMDEIFLILSNQKYNYILKKEAEKIHKQLSQGEELHSILKQNKIYDKNVITAIQKGIESNTLSANLRNILLLQEAKKKEKFEKIVMLIQPLIYLLFGLTIVLLYMSIFIPMFKIMDAI